MRLSLSFERNKTENWTRHFIYQALLRTVPLGRTVLVWKTIVFETVLLLYFIFQPFKTFFSLRSFVTFNSLSLFISSEKWMCPRFGSWQLRKPYAPVPRDSECRLWCVNLYSYSWKTIYSVFYLFIRLFIFPLICIDARFPSNWLKMILIWFLVLN